MCSFTHCLLLLLSLFTLHTCISAAITVTEYTDAGCSIISPLGSSGYVTPFSVESGECKTVGAGSDVAKISVTCDSYFYQLNIWGASSAVGNCVGAADTAVTGTSNQCIKLSYDSNSYIKINCNAGAPSSSLVVRQFADDGCSVPVQVASQGIVGPLPIQNGLCSSVQVGSGPVYLTATQFGPIFSFAVWGSSGTNCAGTPDQIVMGTTSMCTRFGTAYIKVEPAAGPVSVSGSGSVSEYQDTACSSLAPAGSAGPISPFSFTNGACTAFGAGSSVGHFKLTFACSLYSLAIFGSSATDCSGAPSLLVFGIAKRCGGLVSVNPVSYPYYPYPYPYPYPYHPSPSGYAVATFDGSSNTAFCSSSGQAIVGNKNSSAIITTTTTTTFTTIMAAAATATIMLG